ncbi:hypothetical protein [Jeotgalibaca sp. A122]|uniref:hypothetical protein n=1 Tax=Jeotgalibaca sp. A122 TaxID=3457322 RepID=UPI003FD1F0B6
MLKEGVFIPHFCQSLSHLNLPIEELTAEMKTSLTYERFISLDYFRSLYGSDKNKFNKTVHELALRGAHFEVEKGQALFPVNYRKDTNEVISVPAKLEEDAYLNIDWGLLDFSYLCRHFNIRSNNFFSGIPLYGFKSLNPHVDERLLQNEFIESGFLLKDEADYTLQPIALELYSDSSDVKENLSKEEAQILDLLEEYSSKEFLRPLKLREIITKIKYQSLITGLESDGIYYLSDISQKTFSHSMYSRETLFDYYLELNKALNQNLVGLGSVPLYQNILTRMREGATIVSDMNIFQYFSGNSYNQLKKVATNLKVSNISQIDNVFISAFITSNGTGKKKIFDTFDKLYSFYSTENSVERKSETEKEIQEPDYLTTVSPEKYYPAFCLSTRKEYISYCNDYNSLIMRADELTSSINNFYQIKKDELKLSKKAFNKFYTTMQKRLEELKTVRAGDIDLLDSQFDITMKQLLSQLHSSFKFSNTMIPSLSQGLFNENQDKTINEWLIAINLEDHPFYLYLVHFYSDKIKVFHSFNESFKDSLNENEKVVWDLRLVSNEAVLEEVGHLIGVTRERVRQIELKLKKKIIAYFGDDLEFIINVLSNRNANYLDNLNKLIKSHDLLNTFVYQDIFNDYFIYDHTFDLIVPSYNSERVSIILSGLKEKLDFLPKIVSEDVVLDTITGCINDENKQVKYYLLHNLEAIMSKLDYEKYNEGIFIKDKISKQDKVAYIIEHKMGGRIDLNDLENRQIFEGLYKELSTGDIDFSIDTEFDRNIPAILDRHENYIKSASMYYELFDPKHIPSNLFEKIYSYLSTYLTEEDFITSKKLYQIFEEPLEKMDISLFKMYYYLRYLYEEEFSFGHGNTMYIYSKHQEKFTTEELVYRKIVNMGNSVSKAELADELGVEIYTIEQAVSKSDRLVSTNGIIRAVGSLSTTLGGEIKEEILKLGQQMVMEKGYISSNIIFQQLKFQPKAAQFFKDAQIKTDVDFMNALKYVFPDFEGHTKIIYPKDKPISIEEIIISELSTDRTWTRQEISEIGSKYGYAESTMSLTINSLIEQAKLVPVSEDDLILKQALNISEEVLDQVRSLIEKELNNRKFCSLHQISGLRSKLPKIKGYRWKPQLIQYCLNILGYNFVKPDNNSYRTDPLIVLNQKHAGLGYYDLVKEVLGIYQGVLFKTNVAEYLVEKGLLKRTLKEEQILPKDLFYNNVLEVSSIGTIKFL